jgi:hypothetical protein
VETNQTTNEALEPTSVWNDYSGYSSPVPSRSRRPEPEAGGRAEQDSIDHHSVLHHLPSASRMEKFMYPVTAIISLISAQATVNVANGGRSPRHEEPAEN